jgi:hypothetical protein
MKQIIIAVLMVSSTTLFSQAYKVIKVSGSILYKKNETPLRKGNSFNAGEEFLFKTNNSRAAVIQPGKGRFVLKPDNDNLAYAKANLAPAIGNVSSRAGALVNRMDLENYFKGNCVIINKIKLKISNKEFPMDDNHIFYISYKYKGEIIPKKLEYKEDTLIIDKKELLTVDGRPIPNPDITEMTINYLDKTQKMKHFVIGKFNPVFPDVKELKEEIQMLLDGLAGKSRKDKIKEITSYINDFYGKPDKENLVVWLKKEFNL